MALINGATGFRNFATFFKSYMGVMPVVTAAVAPIVTAFKILPIYSRDSKIAAALSGILGFLLLAWVFYARHAMGRAMFSSNTVPVGGIGPSPGSISARHMSLKRARSLLVTLLPLLLVGTSVFCYYIYYTRLNQSVVDGQALAYARSKPTQAFTVSPEILLGIADKELPTRKAILQDENRPIEYEGVILVSYIGIFLFAELAFIVMATREYLQDLLEIKDRDLIVPEIESSGRGESSAAVV
jgi:hypothetical protein